MIPNSTARALSTGSAPGRPEADRAGVDVRRVAERQLAAAEHLRPRLQLDVDLEADHGLASCVSAPRRAASQSKPIACSSAYAASSSRLLAERRAGELEADRQPLAETRRDRDRRDPGERHRHRAEVVHVHRQRVVGLGAELERDPRAGRRDDEVEALERRPEVVGDLGPHLLRGPVVGVVVAARERVGAEHDPPLDLGPEARPRGCGCTSSPGRRRRRPAARSGRRRTGPGWPTPRPARSGSRPTARAAHAAAGRLDRRARARSASASVASKFSRTPGSMPAPTSEPPSSSSGPRAGSRAGPRRVGSSIEPGNGSEVESHGSWPTICDSSSAASVTSRVSGPGLVQRRRERDHAVARAGAVGRLEADDPAQRRRLADRATGVGADRPRRQSGGDRGRAAARRAARHAPAVPRVQHRAESRSSRSTSPSRTRPGWSCRAAARRPRTACSATVAVYGGR